MAMIYKITNNLNGKSYIGQTSLSLQERWKLHLKDSRNKRFEKRPLYSAIRKYGEENFTKEVLEKNIPLEEIAEREIYWIKKYNSLEDGYNATQGGEGRCLYDHSLIVHQLEERKTAKEICENLGCCADIVQIVARTNNLTIQNPRWIEVNQYSLEGEFLQSFRTLRKAADWVKEEGLSKSKDTASIVSHIAQVARGERKTAYKHYWSFPE
ncbi:MAG: GIY-YIG nuclease family protein [Tenuifilaceae bacterium]|nr:GIY-YIG nuclease family protein [Tenuifilaceae bacterium]